MIELGHLHAIINDLSNEISGWKMRTEENLLNTFRRSKTQSLL